MKDGGKLINSKSVIVEILEENRSLYELSSIFLLFVIDLKKFELLIKKIKLGVYTYWILIFILKGNLGIVITCFNKILHFIFKFTTYFYLMNLFSI